MAGLGFASPSAKGKGKGGYHSYSGVDSGEEPQGSGEILKLQSAEGDVYEVELEVARMSSFIKNMLEDSDTDEAILLPNVNTNTLGKIIDYCKHHKGKQILPIKKPLASRDLIECGVSKEDCDYVDIDQEMIFELIKAANYLDIPSLLDLCCAKVASMIKGRTVEEIRQQFKISSELDLTLEEATQVRAGSSPPRVTPQPRQRPTRQDCRALVEEAGTALDIPEGFKTMQIPASFKAFYKKVTKQLASSTAQCSAQTIDARGKMDPRMTLKMSYHNFQEADKEVCGVLNSEQFLHFVRMEHHNACEIMGLELPFDDGLYLEGFACQQFEGKGGITFTDVQIGSHMGCRILKEEMLT